MTSGFSLVETTVEAGAQRSGTAGDPHAPPVAPAASAATRYLSAAVHDDHGAAGRRARRLRALIVDELIENHAKAVGVSPGVDLRPVIVNCRQALRRLLVRDIVLTLLLVALFALGVLLQPPEIVVLVVWLLAAEVVYAEAVFAKWGVVARRFRRGTFDAQRECARGPAPAGVLADVARAQAGNVTIYSGFSPFVGAGLDQGGWSFALNVSRGAERYGAPVDPRPFELGELYDHLARAVEALRIPGLSVEDRLYVDGRALRQDGLFLDERGEHPIPVADESSVQHYIGGGAEAVRHYKTIRVVTWGGELVLSIFLRFSLVEHSLFAEASYFLLTPVDDALHQVDELHERPTWGERARLAARAILVAPVRAAAAPFHVLEAGIAPVPRYLKRRRIRTEVRRNAAFDHGARASLRELAQSRDYRQYFQRLDRELFVKVIEREVFDGIVGFLDAHGIDTSELKQRETTVLNNGVIVTGGSIQAQTMAVGERARAFAGRVAATRSKAPTAGAPKGGAA
jgi:hypothetical protein